MRKLLTVYTALAALALAGLACSFPGAAEEPIPTETPPPTEAIAPTREATPTDIPTITPEPTTRTECIAPGGVPLPDPLPAAADMPGFLTDYLSQGGSLTQLETGLRAAGYLTDEHGTIEAQRDFDGDGLPDVLLVVVNTTAIEDAFSVVAPPGDLYLFTCAEEPGAGYMLAFQDGYLVAGEEEDLNFMPQVVSTNDLTADGADDLLFYEGLCGAHTCYETLQGRRWDGTGFVPLFAENFNGPYPSFTTQDLDADPAIEIVVDGGGIGSVGAGPQRTFRTIYDWAGDVYTVESREQTSPSHPIHVVMDADELLSEGQYEAALEAYERSYADEDLIAEWSDWNEGLPMEALEAYARFRRVVAFIALGDTDAAVAELDAAQAAQPDEPYTGFAVTFWEEYDQTGDLSTACEAVNGLITEDLLRDTLNRFGYANKYYEPGDICPF